MRKAFYILVVVYLVVCAGCCPCRNLGESVESTSADSILRYQREVERINIWDSLELRPLTPSRQRDVLWLNEGLPESERADFPKLKAQTSYLENEYCHSTASVSEDGKLTHTLENNAMAMLPVRHTTAERNRVDSTSFKSNTNRTEVKVKEVIKVTRWQRTQIVALWVLLGILAIAYRKKILSLAKRILPWI